MYKRQRINNKNQNLEQENKKALLFGALIDSVTLINNKKIKRSKSKLNSQPIQEIRLTNYFQVKILI